MKKIVIAFLATVGFLNAEIIKSGDICYDTITFHEVPCAVALIEEGTTDTNVLVNDSTYAESVINNNVVTLTDSKDASVGVGTVMNSKNAVYTIPLNYSINTSLLVNARLKYVRKEIGTQKANGVGDTTVGLIYRKGISDDTLSLSEFRVSIPTGKEENVVNNTNIPLGSGSYDYSLSQSIGYKINEQLRVIGNLSYTLKGTADYNAAGSHIRIEHGDINTLMMGAQYFPSYFNGRYSVKAARFDKKTSVINGSDLSDAMTTYDIIAGVSYEYVEAAIILPVSESYDVPGVKKRKTSFGLQVKKEF